MTEWLLVTRLIACAYLSTLGLEKLVRWRRLGGMWIPQFLRASHFGWMVLCVAAVEVASGAAMALGALGPGTADVLCAVLFSVLSSYGVMSLGAGTSCGCSGQIAAPPHRGSVLLVLLRNVVVFGWILYTCHSGPSLDAISSGRVNVVWLCAAPWCLISGRLLYVVAARLLNALYRREESLTSEAATERGSQLASSGI
jgi:hypothetical protein